MVVGAAQISNCAMVLIGLGANLASPTGPPAQTICAALQRLDRMGVKILSVSSFYQTSAWPDPSDPAFVNAVAAVNTDLQPVELLDLLHEVETAFGRLSSAPNAPRTLDLDLLDYDGVVRGGRLTLPHPRMTERSFVLVPLREIAPHWRHPVSQQTVEDLILQLSDAQVPKRL